MHPTTDAAFQKLEAKDPQLREIVILAFAALQGRGDDAGSWRRPGHRRSG